MRLLILTVLVLSLACSKKSESAPAEAEQAAEAKEPANADAPPKPEANELMDNPAAASEFRLEDLPPLPPELGGETPALDTPPGIIVLDQGGEPRQELRWAVKPGFEQKLSADLGLGVKAIVILIQTSMPETVQTYELTMRAKKVEKDGTIRVAFKVDDARTTKVAGAVVEQTEAQNQALRKRADVAGSYRLSPHGAISDFKLTRASDAEPPAPAVVDALRWALVQMTPALPEEPVGPGAKWTVHESILQGGILVNQLRTIELVKVDGSRLELSMELRQSAAPQPYTSPLTGAKFELESLNGIASGSVTWDLGRLAPLSARIDADGLDGAIFRDAKEGKKAAVAVHTERSVEVGER